MSQSPQKSTLPALDRGLHILDQLIRSESPTRYNELKASLPGVQDSTLSRILKALESYGYIQRDADTGYSITHQVRDWSTYLNRQKPELSTLARREVDPLVKLGEESAAVVLLTDDRIVSLYSRSYQGGIQVLGAGDVLHFEADHAAAIAVLAKLPIERRQSCLESTFSRFSKDCSFQAIETSMQQADGCFLDRSIARPGICRLAQSFQHGQQIGAVFFCLTLDALETKQSQLAQLLEKAAKRLNS